MSDPFGLFQVRHHYPDTTTIMVYPRASHLPHLELPRGRTVGRSASSERTVVETILVGGVRDYHAGDSLRRIHWRGAHHDQLAVRGRPVPRDGGSYGPRFGDSGGATPGDAGVITIAASLRLHLRRRRAGPLMSGQTPA
jgi:hypothetical protein